MAEAWIRMRGSLVTNPKVIKIARVLLQDPEFLEWFGNDVVTDQSSRGVTNSVTRRHVPVVTRITVGALVPLWAMVNECAAHDGILRDASLFEVDEMAGVPGIGRAMVAVGWLFELENVGLEFPNFDEHNTVSESRSTRAKTPAERAKNYRERLKVSTVGEGSDSVTDSSRDGVTEKRDASRDAVTTEKSREEKKNKEPNGSVDKANGLPTCETQAVIDLFHELLPELPSVRLLTEKRKRSISKMWRWVLTSKKGDGSRRAESAEQALAWFREYFTRARDNDFLMGRGTRSAEHANWQCDIDFLMTERGLKQVIEKTRSAGA